MIACSIRYLGAQGGVPNPSFICTIYEGTSPSNKMRRLLVNIVGAHFIDLVETDWEASPLDSVKDLVEIGQISDSKHYSLMFTRRNSPQTIERYRGGYLESTGRENEP